MVNMASRPPRGIGRALSAGLSQGNIAGQRGYNAVSTRLLWLGGKEVV